MEFMKLELACPKCRKVMKSGEITKSVESGKTKFYCSTCKSELKTLPWFSASNPLWAYVYRTIVKDKKETFNREYLKEVVKKHVKETDEFIIELLVEREVPNIEKPLIHEGKGKVIERVSEDLWNVKVPFDELSNLSLRTSLAYY